MNRRSPIRSCWLVLVVMGVVALSGCLPKRVFWSPDGQTAVILTEKAAYLTDANGHLSPAWEQSVQQAAWLPDSKQVIVVWTKLTSNWEQVKPFLSEARQRELIGMADGLRREILAHEGKFRNWRPAMAVGLTDGELGALWLYVREHRTEGLKERLAGEWEEFSKIPVIVRTVELCEPTKQGLQPKTVITTSLDDIALNSLRVSPDGKKFAFVRKGAAPASESRIQPRMGETDKQEVVFGALMVGEIAPNTVPFVVAEVSCWYPDWTPDSKALVYATTEQVQVQVRGDGALGSIVRRAVCDDKGRLLSKFDQWQSLAGILYNPDTKIVCLKNGSILFSAIPVRLPAAAAAGKFAGASLFVLDPDRRATVADMIAAPEEIATLSDGFSRGFYEVSPDSLRVTLVNVDDGEIAVYEFASGTIQHFGIQHSVPPTGEKKKLLDVPTWRTAKELSVIVPPGHPWGSPKRPELVLYSIEANRDRCISKDWPDSVMKSFLPDSNKATQPASTPAQ